jgi:hypothetical protein
MAKWRLEPARNLVRQILKKNDISNEKTERARNIDFLNFQNFFSIHALASYAVNVAA